MPVSYVERNSATLAVMADVNDKRVDLPTSGENVSLSWEAPEFVTHEKSWSWVLLVWAAALAMAALTVWLNGLNFTGILSGSVLILAALALSVQGRAKPKLLRAAISDEGVTISGRLYPWEELTGFWIIYQEANQALYLETKRRFLSIVSVQLAKADPEQVRSALLAHLPEHADRAEEFSDRLSRMIKF